MFNLLFQNDTMDYQTSDFVPPTLSQSSTASRIFLMEDDAKIHKIFAGYIDRGERPTLKIVASIETFLKRFTNKQLVDKVATIIKRNKRAMLM